jgi:hypothetical protein
MTNEMKSNYFFHKPITAEAIDKLQMNGYKYLQVQGFTLDHHPEHVEPHYLLLVPTKHPTGIYEPINSDMVNDWIKEADDKERLEVFLSGKF